MQNQEDDNAFLAVPKKKRLTQILDLSQEE